MYHFLKFCFQRGLYESFSRISEGLSKSFFGHWLNFHLRSVQFLYLTFFFFFFLKKRGFLFLLSCLTPRYNSNSPKKAQGITHNSRDERVLCIHITENSLSNLLLGANHKNTSFVPVSNSLTKKRKKKKVFLLK